MDKKAKFLDRLQNLAIAVLSLSFLFLLVQTPLFGDAGDTTIASTVRGWFTDQQTSAAEEPDSLTALTVPVRIVQSNDFIRSGLDALTTADDAFETVGSFLGEAIGSARGISSVSENTFLSALDGSGLYFAFACDLPLEVLSARLGVQSPTARQLDVRRCLLGLDGEDTATLYLQDTKQGAYRFSTAVSAASVKDYLESQDGGNADFARSLGEEYASLSPYTLVFDSVSARRELSAANALSDYPSEELLRRAVFSPRSKKVLVLGSGGASTAVVYALKKMQAEEVVVVSREGKDNYSNLSRHTDAEMIVNTTPVGMYPHNGESVIDLLRFPNCRAVVDLIYNPVRTALLLQAEELNIPYANGMVMLAAQAMVADGVGAVFTPTDNSIMKAELAIYETFIDAGIPQYTGADSFALNGAFLGYGVDYANLGRETADMIADILLRGADPASTPVRTFDNGTAAVNTETCAALGLDFDTISAAFAPYCTKITTLTTAESFS